MKYRYVKLHCNVKCLLWGHAVCVGFNIPIKLYKIQMCTYPIPRFDEIYCRMLSSSLSKTILIIAVLHEGKTNLEDYSFTVLIMDFQLPLNTEDIIQHMANWLSSKINLK